MQILEKTQDEVDDTTLLDEDGKVVEQINGEDGSSEKNKSLKELFIENDLDYDEIFDEERFDERLWEQEVFENELREEND